MKFSKKQFLLSCLAASVLPVFAQTPVPIPAVLSGNVIDLYVQPGTTEIYPGVATATIGYNGSFLGPTLILDAGQEVQFNVHNQLGDTTTVHWHGLNVSPANDGSPHVFIKPGETWSPQFTILDKAATYWYHPHPHGKTMEQVLLGAAGFFIVRDAEEAALNLPRTYGVDDVPLVFQFKTFDAQKQIEMSDELDNAVLVNGVLEGVLSSPAQMVRYRLLNGSSHRVFRFGFDDNRSFHQIGSDAGLLDEPIALTRLTLGPGERAEILLDLSDEEGNTLTLKTFGSELPDGYPGGAMMMGGTTGPLDDTNFNVLKINVLSPIPNPVTGMPSSLTTNTPWPESGALTRSLGFSAQPMMSMTNFFINGLKFDMETINFSTQQENIEVWNITNQTMMAHPFHIHGNHFYVLSVNGAAPPANMRGRKDVVIVPPMGGSAKLVTRYENFGDPDLPYMYHCHILSHEDGGMMGQFIVNPAVNSIDDLDEQEAFAVSPNPVSDGVLVIKIELLQAGALEFRLYDATGRPAGLFDYGDRGNGLHELSLDIPSFPKGLYFLETRLSGERLRVDKIAVK